VNQTKKPLGWDRLSLMADTMGPLCVRCQGWLAKLGLAFVVPALALVILNFCNRLEATHLLKKRSAISRRKTTHLSI
jgi:hypothetical protein